ncbi:MAG TPA: M23 family metallopeptidase [Steroidobacteraceae bacterium]|nr:M23 family metallopeptidase [Steroidobacteraceae bacterium]HRX88243.1 M23 family metallopeptidase [Steroidobacteraceae bacterium]
MNIILFSRREGRARHFNLAQPVVVGVCAIAGLAVLGGAFALGMTMGAEGSKASAASWSDKLSQQQAEVREVRSEVQNRVDAIAARIGQMNAHVIRLDALGKRLTEMAKIDSREFNFDIEPAIGGPEGDESGVGAQIPDLTAMIDRLEERVRLRDAQMAALENVILARELDQQIVPEGRPVRQGFISSYFGERQDPFSGHQAFHRGVDFAGEAGAEVVAVAAGVVTFSGEKSGYGNIVEVNHGNGLVTRYGHNARNVATVGQTVTRGQTVALMGSTGRSTGPHVHFEVLRDGKSVNPSTFIGR